MALKKLNHSDIQKLKKGQLKGDCIENLYIKANARSFSWFYIFTNPINKQERPKICLGRYPVLSFNEARRIALDYNSLIARGIDPRQYEASKTIQEEIDCMTFKEMAERYREFRKNAVKDISDSMRRVELYIYPIFGDQPLNKIKLVEWHNALKHLEFAKNNTLLKVCGTCKQILDYALKCGYVAENPLTMLRSSYSVKDSENQPTIDPEELPHFMRDLWLCNAARSSKLLVEWQLLTATRANEAVSARWEEIDFKGRFWLIPKDKMKAKRHHKIALNSQALAILEEMQKINGKNEYVFSSIRSKTGCQSTQTANAVIKNMHGRKYKGVLTSHGLRAIFSTYLNNLHDPAIHQIHIEACLAHAFETKVNRSYNHSDYLEQKRYIMQRWGDYIAHCKHP